MFKNVIAPAALVASAVFANTAMADTLVTTVTNSYTATNGCTVTKVFYEAPPTSGLERIVWKVSCGTQSYSVLQETVQYSTCNVYPISPGFSISGSCANYSIYKPS